MKQGSTHGPGIVVRRAFLDGAHQDLLGEHGVLGNAQLVRLHQGLSEIVILVGLDGIPLAALGDRL